MIYEETFENYVTFSAKAGGAELNFSISLLLWCVNFMYPILCTCVRTSVTRIAFWSQNVSAGIVVLYLMHTVG